MPTPDKPDQFTVAAYRYKTDEELEQVLAGGPIGNKSVDAAIVEINRRAGERQEKWARRAYWAAITAAAVAAVGSIAAIVALLR